MMNLTNLEGGDRGVIEILHQNLLVETEKNGGSSLLRYTMPWSKRQQNTDRINNQSVASGPTSLVAHSSAFVNHTY
jgi:hypothetical protein